MAGKTLTGIGEDESGRHEVGRDTSDSAIVAKLADKSADKAPSARPTDRMPMYVGPSSTPTVRSGASPSIDEDKVAEGLKKLRSLDEPLGPIPTSSTMPSLREGIPPLSLPRPSNPMAGTPTIKEGIPVVGLPTPVNPAAIAAAAASELIRSRGTSHGHALSAAAAGQSSVPVSVDDRLKGTLLGHDLHLPDLPAVPSDEGRSAELRPVARSAAPGALVPEPMATAFSHGDSHFFDSEPINNEYEPELEPKRGKMLMRGVIFVSIVAVFVVVAFALHKPDAPPPAETRATPPPAPPQPTALENPAVPGAAPAAAAPTEAQAATGAPAAAPTTAPTAAAPPAAPTVVPVAPPPPPVAAAPEEEVRPAVVEPPPAPGARARSRHSAGAPAPKPVAAAPHTARPVAPHENPKPAVPAKRGKDEDPDGTLPLSE